MFLDIAENNAERNIPMNMNDWKNEVETSLRLLHYEVLDSKGKISAEKEYEKYKIIQDRKFISDFDKLLIETEKIKN